MLFLNISFAQEIDINANTQNNILVSGEVISIDNVSRLLNDKGNFIVSTTQIPAYSLYETYWDTLHLRSKIFTIPFYENQLQFTLVASNNHNFAFPCSGSKLIEYGIQKDKSFHPGIDYSITVGDPIVSCFDGVVRIASDYGAYGNVVVVRHYNGLESVYAHLDNLFVRPGQIVIAGDLIGHGGMTGNTTVPLLHFELRFLNEFFNPELVIDNTTHRLISNTLLLHSEDFTILELPVKKEEVVLENETNIPEANNNQSAYHIVKQGETLYRIAKMYNVSVETIISTNKLSSSGDNIRAGQKLKIR